MTGVCAWKLKPQKTFPTIKRQTKIERTSQSSETLLDLESTVELQDEKLFEFMLMSSKNFLISLASDRKIKSFLTADEPF